MKKGKGNISGEVAAVSGMDFQYSIFATEIYNALLTDDNSIEWIEFASTEAGKIDDVLIGLRNSVLAFQVKNINSSKFSYSSFTISDTQSILQGMFAGWRKLLSANPGKSIDVRLITTQNASNNDKINSFKGDEKASFKQLIENFWIPIHNGKYDVTNIPEEWGNTFQELLAITSSYPKEFIDFIQSTQLIFNYSLPLLFDSYTEQQRRIDIEEIAKNIFNTVGKFGNVRYTKNEFLEKFHLKSRYESYFRHTFFVDDAHFQPITETIDQIEKLLRDKSNGYLALIGNAGSGKSTLLTKWIQQSNYHILKYYAYVNTEMNYEFGFRGEARIFLHDLLVQMRQSPFFPQNRLLTENFNDLQKHFGEELNKLSYHNQKTIIIVDGLDHIVREQDVEKSLIGILPSPDNIPENIYFILGSRTVENLDKLNPRIFNSLKTEKRIIHINPLTKNRVQNFLNSYNINIAEETFEKLYTNTLGHPLFLRYTIEEIKNLPQEDLHQIISERVFSGDIYKEYQVFWEKNKRQDDFVEILGVVSRFRHSAFDISIFNSFPKITREDFLRIKLLSENYFYKIGTVWQFFHNSFKEFLVAETAKNILTGEYDCNLDKGFHLKICEVAKKIDTGYKWNELYHLYKAEEFESVLLLGTQTYFRKQWFDFRNYRLIREDIQLAIEAARKTKEIYCLFGLMLANFEIKQRYNNFTPGDYFSTFYELGQTNLANSFVYDNVELLVSEKTALEYCSNMYQKDFKELAYSIFQKASPSYILNHSKTVSPSRYDRKNYSQVDEIELICAWAKAACLFLPIEKILEQVSSISIEEGYDSRSRNLYSEVFSEMLDVSISSNNENNLKFLEEILLRRNDKNNLFYFYFDIATELPEHIPFYTHSIEKLSLWEISENNPINRRLLWVYLFKYKSIEKAMPIFDKLLPPVNIPKQELSFDDTSILNYIFDYSAFYYIIYKQFSESQFRFLPTEDKYTKIAFYNAFAELGKSYAYIYHNYKDAALGFYTHFENFLHLFRYDQTDYGYEYSISENKSILINLVLKISSKLSTDNFNEILSRLEVEWDTQQAFWRINQIQTIIDYVIELCLNNEWCKNQLKKIDKHLFERGYLDDRIDKAIRQINLWCQLGETEKGSELMQKVMEISLSVRGEKDNQLDYIVGFLHKMSGDISKEIEYYLAKINSLLEKVNSRTHTPSIELLALALKYGNGFEVFKYLLFEGLISFCDAVEILLAHLVTKLPEQRVIITKLFTRVVMAFDNNHGARWRFFEKLLNPIATLDKAELEEIVNEISICSIQEYRDDYLVKIQEYANSKEINCKDVGLHHAIKEKEGYNSVDTKVIELSNGNKMTSDEVCAQVKDMKHLTELKINAKYYSTFDWSPTYAKLFQTASDEEILTFIENGKHEARELSNIAKELIKSNKIEIAKDILYRAIKAGEKSGWVTFYDGGSKIVPFELLSQIEEKKFFQQVVFDDYSNSVSSFEIETTEIQIKDVAKIWGLFSDEPDFQKLFTDIKEFRTELLKGEAVDLSTPVVTGNLDDTTLLSELLFFVLTCPSDFNYSVYEILSTNYPITGCITKNLLEKLYENKFYSKYVKLLAVLNNRTDFTVKEYSENLIALLSNSRYDISTIAYRILESANINPEHYIKLQTKELPFIYGIELDYKPSFFGSKDSELKNINKKGFLKDTDDILILVKLYLTEIKLLSHETNIPVINIAQRVMQLAKDMEFPSWCSSISEEEIRKIYSGRFDLEISYKRPRNQLVWDGLMKVIKEFAELELIDSEMADELADNFDEDAFLFNTKPKPDFIGSILEGTSLRAPSSRKEWVTEIGDEYLEQALMFRKTHNIFILAEHSIIKGMGWGHNEELRQSFISFDPDIDFGNDRTLIFNLTSKNRVKDYLSLQNRGIILYNGLLTINKKRNWLAINPLLCKDLGLLLNHNEGCFRWDDKDGNKIFESVYWQLHSFDNYSRNHDSEAGYGWYVIMYEQGYKLLKDIVRDKVLYQHKKISRHITYRQDRYNTDIDESNFVNKSVKLIL
ncbi:NACHT domain-containing protein [Terrimonas ferruginea]|uniref:NACHT domain-containing protein n=1 Tax=Terrimonas ferruginea TaxID=249 RepID=UPI0004112542|nr:ATP-binding protein [Terrimonas ferruginea]